MSRTARPFRPTDERRCCSQHERDRDRAGEIDCAREPLVGDIGDVRGMNGRWDPKDQIRRPARPTASRQFMAIFVDSMSGEVQARIPFRDSVEG
jgi:hypothetical protein